MACSHGSLIWDVMYLEMQKLKSCMTVKYMMVLTNDQIAYLNENINS